MEPKIVKKVELYSDAGGSDKSYFIFIEQHAEGETTDPVFHVTTKWGPRGGILRDTPLTKKGKLVSFAEAQSIFAKQWAVKANGESRYRVPPWAKADDVSEVGSPSASSGSSKLPEVPFNFAGMKFESIQPEEIGLYVEDNNYWFEQKADGVRGLVRLLRDETTIHAANGTLLKSTYAAKAFKRIHAEVPRVRELLGASPGSEIILDGEILDERFYLFDIPRTGAVSERTPYQDRRIYLEALYETWRPEGIELLPVARTADAKRRMLQELKRRNCEGVMIKQLHSQYQPGRRARHSLKYKFTYTLDAFVIETFMPTKKGTTTESARLGVYKDGEVYEVARASLIGKQHGGEIKAGDVVELKYRGAVKRGVQPTILRRRDDKEPAECLYSQLVFMSKEIVDASAWGGE